VTVNQPKRNGSYAPLSSAYYKDDALAEAGPTAELLYVRGLAFCAEMLSDGEISELQLERFVAVGIRGWRAAAGRLCDVGGPEKSPWVRTPCGYRVRQWLKWNASREEIKHKQAGDAARKRGGTT
jgi:hypothetical protein